MQQACFYLVPQVLAHQQRHNLHTAQRLHTGAAEKRSKIQVNVCFPTLIAPQHVAACGWKGAGNMGEFPNQGR
jgi:hypothetical protein